MIYWTPIFRRVAPGSEDSVLNSSKHPIAGVMQMAMVLQDVATLDMDIESWNAAIRPKVTGTWNLHHLLPDDLDFFLLFSSLGGVLGFPGQSNYAAAGAFLDSFASYRCSQGKIATVIDVGPVDDIGHVANSPTAKSHLAQSNILITEQEVLHAVQLGVSAHRTSTDTETLSRHQIIQHPWSTTSIMDPANSSLWKREARLVLYRNLETIAAAGPVDADSKLIRAFVQALVADPKKLYETESLEFLTNMIRKRVATFIMKDESELDLSMSLETVGVDSLVAIELRSWWAQSFGTSVSMLELLQEKDFHGLGRLAVDRLKERYAK